MHAMKLTAPGGLDQLHLAEIESRAPGFGEIQVEINATSLNFNDYAVSSRILCIPFIVLLIMMNNDPVSSVRGRL